MPVIGEQNPLAPTSTYCFSLRSVHFSGWTMASLRAQWNSHPDFQKKCGIRINIKRSFTINTQADFNMKNHDSLTKHVGFPFFLKDFVVFVR